MHGVGKTLPGLSDFVGLRLLAIDDLDNIVYFRFSERRDIGVESKWVIRDPADAIIAFGRPRPNLTMSGPPLGAVVARVETQPPKTIVLYFESGNVLIIVDDSDQYESFCIPHANVYI